MKIISGMLKGRMVKGYQIKGTRPTMDRVKESIFGSIQKSVPNAAVLDLFAGSGNLGFEALSNGSKYCYFVDKNPIATRTIKENSINFQMQDQSVILCMDYKKALSYFQENHLQFSLVFIDPPYENQIIENVLNQLIEKKILESNAVVVVEMEQNDIGDKEINGLEKLKVKEYGTKVVQIFTVKKFEKSKNQ